MSVCRGGRCLACVRVCECPAWFTKAYVRACVRAWTTNAENTEGKGKEESKRSVRRRPRPPLRCPWDGNIAGMDVNKKVSWDEGSD